MLISKWNMNKNTLNKQNRHILRSISRGSAETRTLYRDYLRDRILVCHLFYRTLSRHQDTHFVELGKHSQRAVGKHHLVWRHLRESECKEKHRYVKLTQDKSTCRYNDLKKKCAIFVLPPHQADETNAQL